MSAVPEDDLPANLVPQSDLPDSAVEETYDPRDRVGALIPAGAGAAAGAVVPPMIRSGVNAMEQGRVSPSIMGRGPIVPDGHTPFNPRGLTVEKSLQNWKMYNEAQLEAAKKVRQESALQKKYPGFTRAGTNPVTAPLPENATMAQRVMSKVIPGGASDLANFAKGVYDYKLPFIGGVGSLLGRGLVGAGAGIQGADAYNRALEGDTTGSVISGIGGVGTALSLIPYTPVKVLGTGVGLTAEAVNAYRDAMRKGRIEHSAPENYDNVDAMGNTYAHGGLAHLAEGGSVMPNVSLDVREMPNMTGMPGVGYMQTPQAAMARMQLEKELEMARLRAGISAMGMAVPGQQGVKLVPGQVDIGANIPLGRGNLDISANRSINPIPGRGHQQGVNARYTLPFKQGGKV